MYAPETKLWSLTFGPVADGIHLDYGLGAGYVPQEPGVPVLVGASEEEMANFTLESGLDITWDNFRQKLLERGKDFGLPVTEENVDGLIDAFRRGNTKNDPPDHLFMKMISLKCHMGVAQNVAEDYAAQKRGPVFLYLNRYDAPNGGHPYRRFAGHCTELCPFFRVVAYPEMEEYSKQVAALFCAFMRTGDPSVEGLAWPAFTLENRAVMQFDRVFSVARDPVQGERAALDAVCGHHGVANAFTRQGYQYDQDLVPPSER